MDRAHSISRAAYAGLVVLICTLLTFATTSAYFTKNAAREAAAAVAISDLFSRVRFDVGAEQSLHREYELEPTTGTLAQHAASAQALRSELLQIGDRSAKNFAPLVDALLLAHQRYLTATHLLFAAVAKHDTVRVRAIDHLIVDRAFNGFASRMDREARASNQSADRALATLRHTEDLVIVLTLVASVVAILVLAVILMVLRHYKQQVDAAILNEMDGLKRAALTDYLTGLGNHRKYQEDLHDLKAAWRTNTHGLTIALIDVDEFKALNDQKGHVMGDTVLAALAKVLRSGDLESMPYRLGGDEFALTFPAMPLAAARARMEHVRRVVEADLGGTTVSIGLATSLDSETDLLLLREQADAALYEAKRRGRNSVVAFDDIADEATVLVPARVAQVRDLITSGTIGVAFQPIWDIRALRVVGYEALARPAGDDPINPQDAFDIAERIGKAHELDRVCRMSIMQRARELPAGTKLFMNVNPQSLDHEEFAGSALVSAFAAVGVSPEQVVLEITERSLARLPVVVREAKRLRALGFALALDDAGSGNSGLEMLSHMPVDYVKIDRDVIVQAHSAGGSCAVLAGIVAIAQGMSAQIIAEGIENAEMLELIHEATHGSTIAPTVQGYYLGRPAPDFLDTATSELIVARMLASVATADRANSAHDATIVYA